MNLISRSIVWAKSHWRMILSQLVISGIVIFLVNVVGLAIFNEGYNVSGDSFFMGSGNFIMGTLNAMLIGAIVSGIIQYRRMVGRKVLKVQILYKIYNLNQALRQSLRFRLFNLLIGLSASIILSLLLNVWTVFLFSFIGLILVQRIFKTAFGETVSRNAGQELYHPTYSSILIGWGFFLGSFLGVMIGNFYLLVGIAGISLLFSLTIRQSRILAAIALLFVSRYVLGDDGGWGESGGTLGDWIQSEGAETVMGYSAVNTTISTAGAMVGSQVASTIASSSISAGTGSIPTGATGASRGKTSNEPIWSMERVSPDMALERAMKHHGKPYNYGGKDPSDLSGLDCSGLVSQSYPSLDGKSAQMQFDETTKDDSQTIDRKSLKRGDLIFFENEDGEVKHVGIVTANKNGKIDFYNSSSSGVGNTKVYNTEGNWGDLKFAGGGKPTELGYDEPYIDENILPSDFRKFMDNWTSWIK